MSGLLLSRRRPARTMSLVRRITFRRRFGSHVDTTADKRGDKVKAIVVRHGFLH